MPPWAIGHYQNELGSNHYRNSAPDRLEGQDSINQSINQSNKQKFRGSSIAMKLAAQTATTFLFGIFACPLPPNDPKCHVYSFYPFQIGLSQDMSIGQLLVLTWAPSSSTREGEAMNDFLEVHDVGVKVS